MKRYFPRAARHLCGLAALWLAACTGQKDPATSRLQHDSAQRANPQPVDANGDSPDSTGSDSAIEAAILDTIFNLPEIKQSAGEIERATGGKRRLQVWVNDTPHLPDQPYYIVSTGEDNGSSLVTENTFYVYTHPARVLYYDVVNDTAISLADWRKE